MNTDKSGYRGSKRISPARQPPNPLLSASIHVIRVQVAFLNSRQCGGPRPTLQFSGDQLECAVAAHVFGTRHDETAWVEAYVRHLLDEEEPPTGRAFRRAFAFDLIGAQQCATPAIQPERVRFHDAR